MHGDSGITLLLGPPNSGKMGRVLDWWREMRVRPPLIVVPGRADVSLLTEELVTRVGPVFGPLPVDTFDGVLTKLLGGPPERPSEPLRLLLLRQILEEADLELLRRPEARPGMPGALGRVFRLLDESGLPAGQIVSGLASWSAGGGGALAAELGHLYELYLASYRGLFAGGAPPDVAARARGAAAAWDRPLACYGFTSFTPAQRGLLAALAQRVSLLLSFPSAARRDGQGWAAAEITHWRPLAAEVLQLERQPRVFSSDVLTRLEAAFAEAGTATETTATAETAADPAAAAEATGATSGALDGVRFLRTAGRRNEVELAGREIVRLLRANVPPGDIAILVRSLSPWQRLIGQVFTAYGIPHRIDGRLPWGHTGLGHALLQALHGLRELDCARLAAFLRSPYGGATPEAVDRLEVRLHRGGGLQGDEAVGRLLGAFSEQLGGLTEILASTADGLREEGRGLSAAEPADVLVKQARRLLERAAQTGALDRRRLDEDSRAIGFLQRLRDELRGGRGPAAPELDILIDLLQAGSIALGREDEPGVVHVLSLARARPRRYPVVFVLGLVQGEFPGEPVSRGLLSPELFRRANSSAGMALFPEDPEVPEDDLFAYALTRPWQLLYLSARDSEDEGEEVLVSPFWTRARELLPDAPLVRRDLAEIVHPPDIPPNLRESLRTAAAGEGRPQVDEDRALLAGLPPWRRPAGLRLPEVRRSLSGRQVYSARHLESYARCPFGWFLSDLVGLQALAEELDALRIGSLVHDVLAGVYRALQTEERLPLSPAALGRARELLDFHLTRAMDKLVDYGTAADRRLAHQEASAHLRGFLEEEAASGTRLRPARMEWRFGEGSGVDLGGLRLRGRIDRVDTVEAGDTLFVIDYKSGSTAEGPRFASAQALQIPLYILALRALHPGTRVMGGAYAALAGNVRAGMVLDSHAHLLGAWLSKKGAVDEEVFEAELTACLEKARQAAQGMAEGVIAPAPPGGCPRYCDLRAVCRGPVRGDDVQEPAEDVCDGAPDGGSHEARQLSLLGDT